MKLIGESAIRARDFAGFVPASRGAHCRPLHPRLASFFLPGKKDITDPRLTRRPGLGGSNLDRQRPLMSLQRLPSGAAHRWTGAREIHIATFQCITIINLWRTFRGEVAVLWDHRSVLPPSARTLRAHNGAPSVVSRGMDRGAGQISNTANSAMGLRPHTSQVNRLELPGWLCPGSASEKSDFGEQEWCQSHRRTYSVIVV